ncbi:hypothetical protein AV530_015712 [Patagioenas fasciata monilis]|uniref:Uncharacterized protein n=1 Tax=Patagioenas fasciata monilis TaxID=372326 RepID=A0A1V4KIJ9_PATFA|nr:hypothetical protein AV530_015712 [Patagioenas fasciata monilis]
MRTPTYENVLVEEEKLCSKEERTGESNNQQTRETLEFQVLQEHPLPPEMRRIITGSVNPSLFSSASCSLGHTQAETQTAVLTSFRIVFFRHTGLQVLQMGELCPALLG